MRPSLLLRYLFSCIAATVTLALPHEGGNLHVRAVPQKKVIITRPTNTDIFYQGQPYAIKWTPPKSKVPVWVSLTATWRNSTDFNDIHVVTLKNIKGDTAVINNGTFWWLPDKTTYQGRWWMVLYTVSEGTDCSKVSCEKFKHNQNSTYLATGEPFMIANPLPKVKTPTTTLSKSTPRQTILPAETVASVPTSTPTPSAISAAPAPAISAAPAPAISMVGIAGGVVGGLTALMLMGAGIVGWRRGWFRPQAQDSFVKEPCEMDGGFDGTGPAELHAWEQDSFVEEKCEMGGRFSGRRLEEMHAHACGWEGHELDAGWPSRKERPLAELPGSEPE